MNFLFLCQALTVTADKTHDDVFEFEKWRNFGMKFSDTIESIWQPFRYTVYVTRWTSSLPGRASLERGDFQDHTIFFDRSAGLLEQATIHWSEVMQSGKSVQFIEIDIGEKFEFLKRFNKGYTLHFPISFLYVLRLLPFNPSFQDILENFEHQGGDLQALTPDLMKSYLDTLLSFNLISIITLT